ncbi:hypothetical protein A4X13_0g6243 [Tilletia indica]|uniref:Uncharacterized protein n=1 Tax=Tilletia indica TaxID=43049 RepID=A0A177TFN5_9BASI|nr:hypothetical protein A4X13_0g6243 [Tilletia indica]
MFGCLGCTSNSYSASSAFSATPSFHRDQRDTRSSTACSQRGRYPYMRATPAASSLRPTFSRPSHPCCGWAFSFSGSHTSFAKTVLLCIRVGVGFSSFKFATAGGAIFSSDHFGTHLSTAVGIVTSSSSLVVAAKFLHHSRASIAAFVLPRLGAGRLSFTSIFTSPKRDATAKCK